MIFSFVDSSPIYHCCHRPLLPFRRRVNITGIFGSDEKVIDMPDSVKPLLTSQPSQTRYDMGKQMENQKRKKVLVVGAGAAGKS